MKNLFAFLVRHNFIFAFLFLEAICIWLMVRHTGYQGSHVLNSSNAVVAGVYQTASNTREYFSLRQENEKLARENAILRNFLKSNYATLPLSWYTRNDTVYHQQFTYTSGKVVNSSVNKQRNFLTINAGASKGIERDMAVISSEGIVGIVTDVSTNFASAMSILNKDASVNCQLKKDGSYGPLVWDGGDYRICQLKDIPTHAKIKVGDTVITSEYSRIFPEGIMVGIVDTFARKPGESFYTVQVRLSADLKKVNHIYIIRNKMKAERDSLEAASQKQSED